MRGVDHEACLCGLIVFEPADLDETALCLICAGSGHESGCACDECSLYFAEVGGGADPADALAAALRSAESLGGSESR